jgi:tripartite-type tricarboxylate transporter receptor subunit TctC
MVIRSTRRALLSGLAAVPLVRPAHAQTDWPTRPVRVMVPYPPAGGADTTARIVYARLSEDLGQQFAIENRGGAGGTIGEEAVAKAAPDGYTILHDATAFSVNGSLYSNLPFDYRKDFDPVFLVALVPNILVVTPWLPTSSRSPKPRPAASTWPRPATARCSIFCSNCSGSAPGSPSITCPIAAAG